MATDQTEDADAAVRKLSEALSLAAHAVTGIAQQNAALMFAVRFLSRELEARLGVDRAALAEEALATMRATCGEDADRELALRGLFGQQQMPKPAPRLTLIPGGKSAEGESM
ncbi:MAG TPA: hypothetical protein VGO18_30180 [Steroidobacteraceae bacterium]|nr:hypothetical protein [Steroidobacteraceae bacterium]